MQAPEGFHVEWVDDEAVVLDPKTGTLHYLNPQAAVVYALMLELGVEAALQQLRESFGTESVAGDLETLVAEMTDKGLLLDG